MKQIFLLLLTCYNLTLYSQENVVTDKLLDKICNTINKNTSDADSIIIVKAFSQHLTPIVANSNAEEKDEVYKQVFYRLQKTCPKFKAILTKITPIEGDWKRLDSKPKTTTNKEDCVPFKNIQSFKYLEPNNDTVNVTIIDRTWRDQFKDGTYSKLNFTWLNDCEFEIEFIESNNESRKYSSVKGEKYRYQILQKEVGYFLIAVQYGKDHFSSFKLYY